MDDIGIAVSIAPRIGIGIGIDIGMPRQQMTRGGRQAGAHASRGVGRFDQFAAGDPSQYLTQGRPAGAQDDQHTPSDLTQSRRGGERDGTSVGQGGQQFIGLIITGRRPKARAFTARQQNADVA